MPLISQPVQEKEGKRAREGVQENGCKRTGVRERVSARERVQEVRESARKREYEREQTRECEGVCKNAREL